MPTDAQPHRSLMNRPEFQSHGGQVSKGINFLLILGVSPLSGPPFSPKVRVLHARRKPGTLVEGILHQGSHKGAIFQIIPLQGFRSHWVWDQPILHPVFLSLPGKTHDFNPVVSYLIEEILFIDVYWESSSQVKVEHQSKKSGSTSR